MPKRLCNCGSCEYCSAYTEFEMDCEFGRGKPRGDTRKQRIKNFIHLQHTEEMCEEFGTAGTTYAHRKHLNGPMPQGEDLVDALARRC